MIGDRGRSYKADLSGGLHRRFGRVSIRNDLVGSFNEASETDTTLLTVFRKARTWRGTGLEPSPGKNCSKDIQPRICFSYPCCRTSETVSFLLGVDCPKGHNLLVLELTYHRSLPNLVTGKGITMRYIYLKFASAGRGFGGYSDTVWSHFPVTCATDGIDVLRIVTTSPEYAGARMRVNILVLDWPLSYNYDQYIRIVLWSLDAPQMHSPRVLVSCMQGVNLSFSTM